MTRHRPNWRPAVKPGDVLEIRPRTTRKHRVVVRGDGDHGRLGGVEHQRGINPFTNKLDEAGHVTHGHLPENSYYGGTQSLGVNPEQVAGLPHEQGDDRRLQVPPGRLHATGTERCIPTIKKGQSITFVNEDASPSALSRHPLAPNPLYMTSIFHSVTTCKYPCGLNNGISYPLANGPGDLIPASSGSACRASAS